VMKKYLLANCCIII